ncbi:hypothetical protein HK100_005865, partial [Physocladia obscura]
GWTSVSVWFLIAATIVGFTQQTHIILRFARYLRATCFWIFTTQWFFGLSILDRIYQSSGSCALSPEFAATGSPSIYATVTSCKRAGGTWSGFDISGHCLLLIHCSILLAMEVRESKKRTNVTGSDVKLNFLVLAARYVALAFQALWWFMLLVTAVHFHHAPEKFVGAGLAIAFWIGEFIVFEQ